MRFKKEKLFKAGQAALMVVLVMAVALGFGISIISQSTTDIRMTEQEQEAARAFNAAEAGIEAALKDLSAVPTILTIDGIQVNYSVTSKNDFEGVYKEGETAQVLIGGNGWLNIEWVKSGEDPGTCIGASNQAPASLLITVHKDDNTVRRVGINACDLQGVNGMSNATETGSDGYAWLYRLRVYDQEDMLRIIPIYHQVSIRVTRGAWGAALPVQLYQINSTAQTETKETKAIEVTRTEPATPSVFDYVLFSGSNLVK